ncbi:hypothetical protein Cgig2_029508 [Carnegiea gigantea]|uniref:Nitrate reductase n=1 Tax=Carnegiea gigantea TaxID=171969 RepID=A0A9Q1KIR8_9CARY|nr:hypothetical protein Cgig2_029508 [Carnegiea gigantea]
MAAVDRQFHGFKQSGLNGVVCSPFSPHHRPNSPIRGCNFNSPNNDIPNPHIKPPQPQNNSPKKPTYSTDSDEDEKETMSEFKEMIQRANTELEPSILDSRDESTPDHWVKRNPSLIRLTGKHPFNCEPPLSQLMHHGFITPMPIHYVRNHGPVPNARWEDWTVEVTGLVKRPAQFTMDQLVTEFPSREFPVTLVCAGNRRMEQNMVKQTIAFHWGAGGVSTSLWRGVPLSDVLKRCGIMSSKKGALNVCFEGAEDLPGGGGSKYGTSIKKEIAMDPARDIILAYMQNGEKLAPDHGFPIRVIVPGFIGGRMVKWLKRIVVTTTESDSYYHYKDNRVLPSHVDAELANSQAWWYKPEYIITELNINSVITAPCHEEILPINSWTAQRPYTLRGYAYSDQQEKGSRYGKYWCWCFWSLEVDVLDLLGAKEIAVRAWDESLNTQPQKLIWNVMTNVCSPNKGETGLVFEHPTQPGSKPGGWMVRERYLDLSDSTGVPFMKSNSKNSQSKMIPMSEVRKHNSAASAWIVVNGHVYDATGFLKDHPGGPDSILINAGTDCTEEFEAIHSDTAKKLLEDFRIGELITASASPGDLTHGGSTTHAFQTPIQLAPITENVALNPKSRDRVLCKLIEKVSISHDVRRFRFELPTKVQTLGLPAGRHILLCATINGKLCMRAYTPTSSVDEVGHFDLVVKIYFKEQHPKFPNGGVMSQHLDSLPLGSLLEVKGPLGHIEYNGRGHFTVHGNPKRAKKLAMIAGGTGITPIYQVMQAVLQDPEDETEMYVVYADRTEDDILLRDELDNWTEEFRNRVKVWYVVQESIRERWQYDTGFVTEKVLREHVPEAGEDVLALTCGPPAMILSAVQPNLEKMGYDIKEKLLVF